MKCQNRQFTKFISLLKFPGLQYLAFKKLGFFERQSTVSSFSSQVLFQTSDAPILILRIQMQTPWIALRTVAETHQRCRRCVWEATMYGRLPFKKLGYLTVQLRPIFLLKCSLRRASTLSDEQCCKLSLDDTRWITLKQSKTETRKTAFCSLETLKSHADDRPTAAGCPSLTQTIIVQMVYWGLGNSRSFPSSSKYVQGLHSVLLNILYKCFFRFSQHIIKKKCFFGPTGGWRTSRSYCPFSRRLGAPQTINASPSRPHLYTRARMHVTSS